MVVGRGGGSVAAAGALSPPRRANGLRAWWAAQTGHSAPQALITRLLAEVRLNGVARWPAGGGWGCAMAGGRLRVVGPAALAG